MDDSTAAVSNRPIFTIIFVKYNPLFASNDRKNCLNYPPAS